MQEYVIKDWKTKGPLASIPDHSEDAEEKPIVTKAVGLRPGEPAQVSNDPSLLSDPPMVILDEALPVAVTRPGVELREDVPATRTPAPKPIAAQVEATPRIESAELVSTPRKGAVTPAMRAARREPSKPRKRGESCFIARYDGKFIGLLEVAEPITPREAYLRVAHELAADREDFVPERLQLFKPVLLKSAKPAKSDSIIQGKLEVFEGHRAEE